MTLASGQTVLIYIRSHFWHGLPAVLFLANLKLIYIFFNKIQSACPAEIAYKCRPDLVRKKHGIRYTDKLFSVRDLLHRGLYPAHRRHGARGLAREQGLEREHGQNANCVRLLNLHAYGHGHGHGHG